MSTSEPTARRRKTNLVEFQRELHERFRSGAALGSSRTRLAFELGPQSWLVPLSEVSEVLPVPALEAVPLAKPWFLGIANVRGNLFAVADLQNLLGLGQTGIDSHSRLLLLNRNRLMGSALLVTRTVGLRQEEQLQVSESGAAGKFTRHRYRDTDGREWAELDVRRLVGDAEFLRVSRLSHDAG